MRKKLAKNYLLLPLILVLVSILLESSYFEVSRLIKLAAVVIIIANVIILKTRNIHVFLSVFFIVYMLFLIVYNDIFFRQGLEDGIRYLFPLITLVYSLQLKEHKKEVILILIAFVFINDLYQLLSWLLNPVFSEKATYKLYRAKGLVGFFDFFGFINMVALILINEFKIDQLEKKGKTVLNIILALFLIWSLSLKMIVIFILYCAILNRKLIIAFLLALPLTFVYKNNLWSSVQLRINRYLVDLNSARNESYRVVKNYYNEFLFIGKGPGTFGGPASKEYQSKLYEVYNFNWYGEPNLSTTDTYYPHLLVEYGIFFGICYLIAILVLPIIFLKKKKIGIIIILILSINSIFSFALNSISYCFFSLILIYLSSEIMEIYEKKYRIFRN